MQIPSGFENFPAQNQPLVVRQYCAQKPCLFEAVPLSTMPPAN